MVGVVCSPQPDQLEVAPYCFDLEDIWQQVPVSLPVVKVDHCGEDLVASMARLVVMVDSVDAREVQTDFLENGWSGD